jgi:hypothetical protein
MSLPNNRTDVCSATDRLAFVRVCIRSSEIDIILDREGHWEMSVSPCLECLDQIRIRLSFPFSSRERSVQRTSEVSALHILVSELLRVTRAKEDVSRLAASGVKEAIRLGSRCNDLRSLVTLL